MPTERADITCTQDVLDIFPVPGDLLRAPGRTFVTVERVCGAKTPRFLTSKKKAKQRQYYFILFSDVVVVGKYINGIFRKRYRAKLFPLQRCNIKNGNRIEDSFFPVRLTCSGSVAAIGDPKQKAQRHDEKDAHPQHFTFWCHSASQRDRIVGKTDDTLRALNATIAQRHRAAPVSNSMLSAQQHSGKPQLVTSTEELSHPTFSIPMSPLNEEDEETPRSSIASSRLQVPSSAVGGSKPPTHTNTNGDQTITNVSNGQGEEIRPASLESVASVRTETSLPPAPPPPSTKPRIASTTENNSNKDGIKNEKDDNDSNKVLNDTHTDTKSSDVGSTIANTTSQAQKDSVTRFEKKEQTLPVPTTELSAKNTSLQTSDTTSQRVGSGPGSTTSTLLGSPNLNTHSSKRLSISPAHSSRNKTMKGQLLGIDLDIDALPSVPQQREDMGASIDKSSRHRHQVYCEILDTEKLFVKDLQVLVRCFIKPLRSAVYENRPILSSDTIDGLFANAEALLQINAELLQTLCQSVVSGTTRLSDSFADAFIGLMPFFRLYTQYCKNYWNALDIVKRESESNVAFKGFLKFCYSKPETRGLDLASYLIKPVQRICKYPLFFKDLLKHMDSEHAYRPKLVRALDEVERVASEVNGRITQEERNRRILEVFRLLDGSVPDLLQPGRRFVLDKPEVFVSFPNRDQKQLRKARPYRVFLFTDCLIVAQHTHGDVRSTNVTGSNAPRYKVVENLDLKQISLRPGYGQNVDDIALSPTISPPNRWSNSTAGSETDNSTGNHVRGMSSVLAAQSSEDSGFGPARSTESSHTHSRSLARYSSSALQTINPGAGLGPGGSDLYLFDLVYSVNLRNKDGEAATAVDKVTFWCKSPSDRENLFETLRKTADEWKMTSDDLHRRRARRASTSMTGDRTRAFRKHTINRFSGLGDIREKYTTLFGTLRGTSHRKSSEERSDDENHSSHESSYSSAEERGTDTNRTPDRQRSASASRVRRLAAMSATLGGHTPRSADIHTNSISSRPPGLPPASSKSGREPHAKSVRRAWKQRLAVNKAKVEKHGTIKSVGDAENESVIVPEDQTIDETRKTIESVDTIQENDSSMTDTSDDVYKSNSIDKIDSEDNNSTLVEKDERQPNESTQKESVRVDKEKSSTQKGSVAGDKETPKESVARDKEKSSTQKESAAGDKETPKVSVASDKEKSSAQKESVAGDKDKSSTQKEPVSTDNQKKTTRDQEDVQSASSETPQSDVSPTNDQKSKLDTNTESQPDKSTLQKKDSFQANAQTEKSIQLNHTQALTSH